jgi:hypothetical protein
MHIHELHLSPCTTESEHLAVNAHDMQDKGLEVSGGVNCPRQKPGSSCISQPEKRKQGIIIPLRRMETRLNFE